MDASTRPFRGATSDDVNKREEMLTVNRREGGFSTLERMLWKLPLSRLPAQHALHFAPGNIATL